MMKKVRISLVSYSNTLPFLYGIQQYAELPDFDLSLDNPAVCAQKLESGFADIGLIPIATLTALNSLKICSRYCIGSNGPVRTVCLFSQKPIHEIKSIYLDYQSRTSRLLLQLLAKIKWNIQPKWIDAEEHYEELIEGDQAGLVIGDRVFDLEGKFAYSYDLAAEWTDFARLPFVFAVWATNKNIDPVFLDHFEKALSFGVSNTEAAVENYTTDSDLQDKLKTYLSHNISFDFDREKQQALYRFEHLLQKYLQH